MDAKFVVNLSGRDYPLFAGVLAEAHERGLQSITVELVQIPEEANGNTAIMRATVTMKDGSQFSDYGDANPRNTNARIATALLRMASTRAKGRALRDAINCGQALLEELPDLEDHPSAQPYLTGSPEARLHPAGNGKARAQAAVTSAETQATHAPIVAKHSPEDKGQTAVAKGEPACADCGAALTSGMVQVSTKNWGMPLCPAHQKARMEAQRAKQG